MIGGLFSSFTGFDSSRSRFRARSLLFLCLANRALSPCCSDTVSSVANASHQ